MFLDRKKYKVILVGSSGVGKTSIMNSFNKNKKNELTTPTIGSDFSMDVIKKPLSMGCQNLYLVKDDSGFITGTTLNVNGGQYNVP